MQSRQEALIHLRQQAGLHSPLPRRQPPQFSPPTLSPTPTASSHITGLEQEHCVILTSKLAEPKAEGRSQIR